MLETEFTFDVTVRWGDLGSAQGLTEAILRELQLYIEIGGNSQTYSLYEIQDVLQIDTSGITENPTSGTVTISGMWKYNLDGTEAVYYITCDDGAITSGDLPDAGLEEGDSFSLTIDNSNVLNVSSVTDRLYSGGSLYLTLTGTTDYHAVKMWLDDGEEETKDERPTGEFQLWRYRAGSGYTTAAPVRDGGGEILTIDLTQEDTISIDFSDLPKYDSEGYEYIYVVREYMDGGGYEQVFGAVQEDGSTDDTVWVPGDDGHLTEGVRESGDTYLYDKGTLSNRITDTVQTEAVKTWEASAFQADFEDVTVVLTLQSRLKNDPDAVWEDVVQNGSTVTETMDDFTAENLTASVSRTMPRYDELGRELEYRWVETAVYQGEELTDNLLETDGEGGGSFTLVQENIEVRYDSESVIDEGGDGSSENPYSTDVTNSIANTIDYLAEKIWLNEEGEEYEPENTTITFNVYRILSGGSLSEADEPYFTFEMDGTADGEPREITVDGETFTVEETKAWVVTVSDLPQYDSEGREYEYVLLENAASGITPTYETIRDEDGNYSTTITNAPGTGHRITVRKEWIDDSDLLHRGTVVIGVYSKVEKGGYTQDELIAAVELKDGIWQAQVGIGELDPETEVYVREISVDGNNVVWEEGDLVYESDDASEYTADQVETENHRYEVTYQEAVQIASETVHTVVNRRLGNVDLTVTKEWVDGTGEIRDQIADVLEGLAEEDKISLAVRLEFADGTDADANEYVIDYENNTVTVSPGNVVVIRQPGEGWQEGDDRNNLGNSEAIQAIDLGQASSTYYFWNLPKYDRSGRTVHYQVDEVWVKGNEVVSLSELAANDPDTYDELYELWSQYQTAIAEESYETAAQHDIDKQEISITNRLSGTKTLLWHKQWNDTYNNATGQRPDIYLNIYAVKHVKNEDGSVSEVAELYQENYRWDSSQGDVDGEDYSSTRHWHAVLDGVPMYDELGYEIIYYAVENMSVDGSSFDYQDTAYRMGETELGTVKEADEEAQANGNVWYVTDADAGECYALKEGGTFVNTISGTVTIQGRKLWTNLPASYPAEDFPTVTFALYRNVQGETESIEVATLTVSEWADIYSNGSYTFEILYEGTNTMTISKDQDTGETIIKITGEAGKDYLPKYDPAGRLYEYTLKEKEIKWSDEVEGSYDETPGESAPDEGNIFDTPSGTAGTYQINNTYQPLTGELSFRKYLYLPLNEAGTPEAYPAVTFEISRTYTTNEGTTSDEEIVDTVTWSSAKVKEAYQKLEANSDAKSSGLVEWFYPAKDLAIYAPNGSRYTYTITEVKTDLQGYDTWAVNRDVEAAEIGSITDPTGPDENYKGTEVTDLYPAESSDTEEPSNAAAATFINKQVDPAETVKITGQKVWAGDADNSYGTRYAAGGYDWEVCFVVQRTTNANPDEDDWENVVTVGDDGTEEAYIVRLHGDDTVSGLSAEITGLPKTDAAGNTYYYRAQELAPDADRYADRQVDEEDVIAEGGEYNTAYTAAYTVNNTADHMSTTVTNTMTTTRFYAEKSWLGEEAADSVTLELQYQNEAGSWVSIGSGAEVTLDGGADTDAERDGASWYEYDGWKAVWMNVPESMPGSLLDAEGKTQYRIVETVPGGYIQVGSGTDVVEEGGNEYTEYTFINSKSVTVAAEKVWYADSDQQQEVTAALYRTTGSAGDGNSEQVTDSDGSPVTLKLNASNSWKASVSNLPKYDENGEEYIYYVRETEIGGSGELSGFRILYEDEGKAGDNAFSTVLTNIQRTELEVTKIWKDNADLYGTRPEDVELILWRSTEENPDPENAGDWEQVTEETLDAEGASLSERWTKADDEWYFSFTGLPAYSSKGETYTYRVSEAEISLPEDAAAGAGDGYESSWDAETGTLTNTLTGTTEVTVTKKWVDGSDRRGERPESITVILLADGSEHQRAEVSAGSLLDRLAKALTGQDTDVWTYTFTNLPKYNEDGKRIEYTVVEEEEEGYDVSYDGYTITNTSRYGALSIEKNVTGDGAEKDRYFTFTVVLKDADGNTLTGEYEYTGSGSGTIKSGDAIQLKHGQRITIWDLPAGTQYEITESGNDGYEMTAEGAAGTIEGGSTSEASFENYKPGSEDGDGGSSSGSSGSSSTSQAGGAETGDSKSPGIWIALILLSAGCITGILLYTRKIKSEKTQNRSE